MLRTILTVSSLLALTACGGIRDDLAKTPDPIGRFLLGYDIVVSEKPQKGPFSRNATNEEWIAAVEISLRDRFSRYDGDQYYHIAVSVDGYVLGIPGIPIVYSPRSVLIIGVTFYEDATQQKLNPEPIRLTVFEPCCSVPLLGTGYTRSAEKQMEGLAFNAARAIERTMRQNADWFGGTPETLAEDPTIVAGNVLVDNPEALAPPQVATTPLPATN